MGKSRWKKILAQHLGIAVLLAVLILTVWHCPVRLLFGVPCPGCGVTRAVLSVLRLDLPGAFAYNPAFPLIILLFLHGIHREVLVRKAGKRWNVKIEAAVVTVFVVIIIGIYLFRLIRQDSPVMEICPENGLITRLFRILCR